MQPRRWALLGVLLALLGGCSAKQPSSERPPPLPQAESIAVYFNRNRVRGANYRDIRRAGDDLEQAVTEAIASAQSRVDVAVQALRLPRVARALIERHQAGVQVASLWTIPTAEPGAA